MHLSFRSASRLMYCGILLAFGLAAAQDVARPTSRPAELDSGSSDRMAWWREARFGLFIHWGLYAIPAGEWGGKTDYGEWIRSSAKIPRDEYAKLRDRFHPVKFDARAWVKTAKDAGMRYVVITTKHHDGFCLFDSKHTDQDVMSTPSRTDIMRAIADACREAGIKFGWYYSIMDWHHGDYVPRRDWEAHSTAAADYRRYVAYMKAQLRELLTAYGPIDILWFDGQWEGSWTHELGLEVDAFVRKLQPNIIVNNRVDKGGGQFGMTKAGYAGDFGTPEQEIPPEGVPGVDWETCMTMNRHWGYNRADQDWKSSQVLIRHLVDIASKGGNFLLNVGPTAEGEIPAASVERLEAIGEWMRVNGESIHGTQAGPFKKPTFGRSTQRSVGGVTRLYLQVFDWPQDGLLVVPGLFSDPNGARLLGAAADTADLRFERRGDDVVVHVPATPPFPAASVVVLDMAGRPDVAEAPLVSAGAPIFTDWIDVAIGSPRENVTLRLTTDGSEPQADSALAPAILRCTETTRVRVRAYRGTRPVSPVTDAVFRKVVPRPAVQPETRLPGFAYDYVEGDFDRCPDFTLLVPKAQGRVDTISCAPRLREDRFAFRWRGFLEIPTDGVYTLSTTSDDGSRLWIGDDLIVDNDGLHSLTEKSAPVALAAGLHPITVTFFEATGGFGLEVGHRRTW